MKILKSLLLLLVVGALFSFTNQSESTLVTGDGDVITWKGKKVTGSHEGTISLLSGSIEFNAKDEPIASSFTIDMNSITCTDLDKGAGDKLVGHLKSDDFFGVASHPVATFEGTRVSFHEFDKGSYVMTGFLTIKGIKKQILFPFTVTEENGSRVANAVIKIDRTRFDVRYGSGKFFDNLGDKMIYDEFELNVQLVAR